MAKKQKRNTVSGARGNTKKTTRAKTRRSASPTAPTSSSASSASVARSGRPGGRERKPRPPSHLRSDGSQLDHDELLSIVCQYFCNGRLPAEISKLLLKDYGIKISRERVYRMLTEAARKGRFHFNPPLHHQLKQELESTCNWLREVSIPHSAAFDDVALETARLLVRMLQERARPPLRRKEVHLGFAGGHTIERVAQFLAELLKSPQEGLPDTIVLHALVAGFDAENPTTSPVAFFTHFRRLAVNVKFVGLFGAPLVDSAEMLKAQKSMVVSSAYERRSEVDIIVTSGASWNGPCRHSMLRIFMKNCPESLTVLQEAGCVGDLMWRPISAQGPIEVETKTRALTLIELSHLPRYIEEGKSVVLMMGPCIACRTSRGHLLKTILDLPSHLITHLVTDSVTARQVLDASA